MMIQKSCRGFGLGTYLILILFVIIFSLVNIKYQISNIKTENSKLLIIALLSGYITILITNFFGFSITMINLFFYLLPAFIFIIPNSSETFQEKKIVEYSFNNIWQKVGVTVVLLLSLYGVIYIVRYWLADVNYAKGDSYYKIGNYQAAGSYLNEALKLKYEHVYEDKLSYVLANLAFVSAYQKQEETAKQLINLANFYNKKSLEASPKNSLYWKTTAKNYYLFYQVDQSSNYILEAVQALKIARTLAPTDPKISYSLSIFYSLLADSEKNFNTKKEYQNLAIKEAETAIKLKPNDQGYKELRDQLLQKYPLN